MKKTYLGSMGKVFGPFSEKELEILESSKEIERFQYIWKEENQQWIPLHAVPLVKPGSQPQKSKSLIVFMTNHQNVLQGRLDRISETGCEVIISEREESLPFALQSGLTLCVESGDGKKSTSIKAIFSGIEKAKGFWIYKFRWNGLPDLPLN